MNDLPKIIVFASGEKEAGKGGSGFKKLVEATLTGVLKARIVTVASNYAEGGVFTKVREFKRQGVDIPFIYSPKGRSADDYRRIIGESGAEWVALSGWLGQIEGHDPRKTFNIHPAYDLPRFGGKGMWGHHVHEAVVKAHREEGLAYSGVTMHFATARYDDPSAVFFKRAVPILPGDDADALGQRVNKMEHAWQAIITNRVVHGEISWDGKNPESILGADIELMKEG